VQVAQISKPGVQNRYLEAHATCLCASFRKWTGRELIDPGLSAEARARELFYAPFVVLSHNGAPDPILNYANESGLRLFDMRWDELIVMPSRLTAQAPEQAERDRLLAAVSQRGFIDDYSGVRIAKNGRKFKIERATVWNLFDEGGAPYGQAATFSQWRFLD
jgi:MEKHLA domain-containing protein